MYFLYSLLLTLVMVLLSPYFLVQGLRHKKYLHNIGERLGLLPRELRQENPGALWLHAVSVGEALAATELAAKLKQRFPQRRLFVSTTTLTGQLVVRERMPFVDGTFYFPFDWAHAVRRTLRQIQPALVVIVETEIWPNFLREAHRAGVRVVFANGRISDRSFHRYGWLRGLLGRVLATPELFLMQSEEDARRLIALGADPGRVRAAGNLKYDFAPQRETPVVRALEQAWKGRRVLVAGSTMPGEEEFILEAAKTLRAEFADFALLLAPRHPERFAEVWRAIESRNVRAARRSEWREGEPLGGVDVFLLDSVGELAAAYCLAEVALVGGSFIPRGGHNILEPAYYGKPIMFGPFMENFREQAGQFVAAGAARQLRDASELTAVLRALFASPQEAADMGKRARDLLGASRGATDRVVDAIVGLLQPSGRLTGVRA